MRKQTQQLTLSAMFIALAVLFPMLFHTVNLGTVFLPMFWPVAAAAFFLNLPLVLAVAVLSPLLSSLMTGMPPISPPILPMLMAELVGLGIVIHFCYKKLNWSILLSLFLGLIFTRIILLFTIYVAAPIIGLPRQVFSISMLTHGWTGLATIFIFLPIFLILFLVSIIVSRVKQEPIF